MYIIKTSKPFHAYLMNFWGYKINNFTTYIIFKIFSTYVKYGIHMRKRIYTGCLLRLLCDLLRGYWNFVLYSSVCQDIRSTDLVTPHHICLTNLSTSWYITDHPVFNKQRKYIRWNVIYQNINVYIIYNGYTVYYLNNQTFQIHNQFIQNAFH